MLHTEATLYKNEQMANLTMDRVSSASKMKGIIVPTYQGLPRVLCDGAVCCYLIILYCY